MTIRVLLADDQALLRSAFRVLVDSEPDMEVVGEASDGAEAARLAAEQRADVVLMDIRMPGTDGLAATRMISADPSLAHVRVVILTTFEVDDYVVQSLRAGASGFLGKGSEPEELLSAIRVAAGGEALLSPTATKGLIARFLAQQDTTDEDRDPARAERLESLTVREREVLVQVAAWALQRRDRRAPRGQPAHREDPRQPGHGQAGRPRPGPAGRHRLRIRAGPSKGGVTSARVYCGGSRRGIRKWTWGLGIRGPAWPRVLGWALSCVPATGAAMCPVPRSATEERP